MRESAKNVAKKTGLSEKEVREKIEREIEEIIRRSFYKSPVTDFGRWWQDGYTYR